MCAYRRRIRAGARIPQAWVTIRPTRIPNSVRTAPTSAGPNSPAPRSRRYSPAQRLAEEEPHNAACARSDRQRAQSRLSLPAAARAFPAAVRATRYRAFRSPSPCDVQARRPSRREHPSCRRSSARPAPSACPYGSPTSQTPIGFPSSSSAARIVSPLITPSVRTPLPQTPTHSYSRPLTSALRPTLRPGPSPLAEKATPSRPCWDFSLRQLAALLVSLYSIASPPFSQATPRCPRKAVRLP